MAALAIAHGVPTPNLVIPNGVEDVRAYATVRRSGVLKGIDGARLKVHTGRKMVIVEEPAELERLYQQMEDPKRSAT